ncbi:MAG: hypothetical protein WEA76_02465 [Acidimicrobiia bacterium]
MKIPLKSVGAPADGRGPTQSPATLYPSESLPPVLPAGGLRTSGRKAARSHSVYETVLQPAKAERDAALASAEEALTVGKKATDGLPKGPRTEADARVETA